VKLFLTVGSMLPFDRLVKSIDLWAKENPEAKVFAQIGETSLQPKNLDYRSMITPGEYREHFLACDAVISHVGMGTVITAFECNKPLIMLPRLPELNEHTSNHQIATARWLEGRPGIRIVYTEDELAGAIAESVGSQGVSKIDSGTRVQLIGAILQFISS
jgi:UDP-N-acetylglucosamine transferase subunit ALG13